MTLEPTLRRHRRALMLGCVLSSARIPWLRWPLRSKPVWGRFYA